MVTLALYTYFIAALLGRQFVPDATGPVGKFEEPDMYFPFFTALQVKTSSLPKIFAFFHTFSLVLFLRRLAKSGRGPDKSLRRGRRRHRAQLADRQAYQGEIINVRRQFYDFPNTHTHTCVRFVIRKQ